MGIIIDVGYNINMKRTFKSTNQQQAEMFALNEKTAVFAQQKSRLNLPIIRAVTQLKPTTKLMISHYDNRQHHGWSERTYM